MQTVNLKNLPASLNRLIYPSWGESRREVRESLLKIYARSRKGADAHWKAEKDRERYKAQAVAATLNWQAYRR